MALVVDNSISMADKQAVLAPSVRQLIQSLVNPACVDEGGAALPESQQPATGQDPCPPGADRSSYAASVVTGGGVGRASRITTGTNAATAAPNASA